MALFTRSHRRRRAEPLGRRTLLLRRLFQATTCWICLLARTTHRLTTLLLLLWRRTFQSWRLCCSPRGSWFACCTGPWRSLAGLTSAFAALLLRRRNSFTRPCRASASTAFKRRRRNDFTWSGWPGCHLGTSSSARPAFLSRRGRYTTSREQYVYAASTIVLLCASSATTPRSTASRTGRTTRSRRYADRPGARRPAQDQVGAGRLADVPPLLRPRRLRLRRHAHQRPNRLACKTLIKDLNTEQADHRRADQGPAGREGPDRRHGAVLRRLPRGHAVPDHHGQRADPGAHPEPAEDRERFDDTTKCILCAACTSSLPGVLERRPVLRPGGDRQRAPLHLRHAATRAATQRLEILNDKEGVWRCRTTFNCTEACPRGIEVTKAIQEVKRALLTNKF